MYNIEYFKYHLLDNRNNFIKELDNVTKCNIAYVALSNALKQSATIEMNLDTNEALNINNRIRVIHHLNGLENPLGTFLLSTPVEKVYKHNKTVSIECYSVLWLLNANKTTTRYYVPRGTNAVNEVKRLLAGFEYNLVDSIKTTSTDREWEIGTPYVQICNDLLNTINYTSLYPLADGSIASRPYIMPEDRVIQHTYDESDPNNRLEIDLTNELDYYDVPNIFVRYVSNPETPNLVATYENNNPNSPTSTANRPKNVNALEVMDISDIQTLFDICKKECSEATNKYNKIEFRTAINPAHAFMDCIYINLNGITDKFIETRWEIDCTTGGTMIHHARKVVTV
ncbi:MAG: hypothetical protein ACRCX8_10280 [Sarcina sp.]